MATQQQKFRMSTKEIENIKQDYYHKLFLIKEKYSDFNKLKALLEISFNSSINDAVVNSNFSEKMNEYITLEDNEYEELNIEITNEILNVLKKLI
jgi:hypothetical protein